MDFRRKADTTDPFRAPRSPLIFNRRSIPSPGALAGYLRYGDTQCGMRGAQTVQTRKGGRGQIFRVRGPVFAFFLYYACPGQ